jgi:hypothetical protein
MKWEYLTEEFNGDVANIEKLNNRGLEGWELISIVTASRVIDGYSSRQRTCAYFKRPIN